MMRLYRDFADQAALDAEYDPSRTVAGAAGLMAEWQAKSTTALEHLGDRLDVWIVEATTLLRSASALAHSRGVPLWAVYTHGGAEEHDVLRYYSGLWAWANGVQCCLVWAYQHNRTVRAEVDGTVRGGEYEQALTYAVPRADGTILSTPGYDGYVAGIADCRRLEQYAQDPRSEVQAFLAKAREAAWGPLLRPAPIGAMRFLSLDPASRRRAPRQPSARQRTRVGLPPTKTGGITDWRRDGPAR